MTTLPLARFKILDLTRVRAGPTCVRNSPTGAPKSSRSKPPKAMPASERHTRAPISGTSTATNAASRSTSNPPKAATSSTNWSPSPTSSWKTTAPT